MRSKFRFLKRFEIKITQLVFLLFVVVSFYYLFAFRAIFEAVLAFELYLKI